MKPFRYVWCKPYGVFFLVWSEIAEMMKTATTMTVTQQQQLVMDTILKVHVQVCSMSSSCTFFFYICCFVAS